MYIRSGMGADMQSRVSKWGNSLAVRIPSAAIREMALVEGSEVQMTLDGDRLILQGLPHRISIDSLVSAITPENVHNETDWGAPEGTEQW
jgi:antitoxin MazE